MSNDSQIGTPEDSSFWSIVKERRYTNLFFIGLIALITSFLGDSILELLRDNLRGHVAEPLLFWLKAAAYFAKLFVALLRDIGFACWIALILGVFVERVARAEQKSIVQSAIEQIRNNVLLAAFGIRVPPALAALAIEKVFSAPVVRESYRLSYTLLAHPGFGPDQVLLRMEIDSIYRNVSGRAVDHDVRLKIPLRTDPLLRHHSKLLSGSIGSAPLSHDLIAQGDAAVSDSDYEKQYLWQRRIDPGGTLHVVLRIQIVKDRADNEVWTSLYPSDPPNVTVDVQCDGLEWNVHPLFCGDLPTPDGPSNGPRPSGQIVSFAASAPLFPYHGLVLWWRPKPGESTPKPVVAESQVPSISPK